MYDRSKEYNTLYYIVKLLICRKRHSDESQNLKHYIKMLNLIQHDELYPSHT